MVSPGKLRALRDLKDGASDAFEPAVSETGTITYPSVECHLEGGEHDRDEFLETMADRGVVASEFEYKVYICPHCSAEGMQYSTGCPDCGSVHAIQESIVVHSACGTRIDDGEGEGEGELAATAETVVDGDASDSDSEGDGDPYCSDCEEPLSGTSLEHERQYLCHDCSLRFDSPTHRLWCRDCSRVSAPTDVREEPLVRYPLTRDGHQWVTEQLDRRRLLAETFESRGYETSVDTTVPAASGNERGDGNADETGTERPVHVYAVDDLLDYRIVAGVHGSPTVDDVNRLVEAAREAEAQPLVLLTDGAVDERVSELFDQADVTVVSGSNGMLSPEYEVRDRAETPSPITDWLESLFSPSGSKR